MAFTGLGTGTEIDPYQITTIEQFKEMNGTSADKISFQGSGLNNQMFWGSFVGLEDNSYIFTVKGIGVKTITVANGGTGYVVGNTFYIENGTANKAVGRVASIGANGVVLTATMNTNGTGYTVASSLSTSNITGVGIGLVVNVTALVDVYAWTNVNTGVSTDRKFETTDVNLGLNFLIKFGSDTGHTVGDKWTVSVKKYNYWVLMNDIDNANQDFSMSCFNQRLNGNGFKLKNLKVKSGVVGFSLNQYSELFNLKLHLTEGSSSVFGGNNSVEYYNINNVTLKKLHIISSGFNGNIIGNQVSDTSVIDDIIIEGHSGNYFQTTVSCNVTNVRVAYPSSGAITVRPLVDVLSYATIRNCKIIIPYMSTGASITGIFARRLVNGTIDECALSGNIIITNQPTNANASIFVYEVFGTAASSKIKNSYFKGFLSVDKGETTSGTLNNLSKSGYAICGINGIRIENCLFIGNIISPLNANRTILVPEFNIASNNVKYSYYNKTKLSGVVPKDIAGQQIGLTSEQISNQENYTTWDFSACWQIDNNEPSLRNIQPANFESKPRFANTSYSRISPTQLKFIISGASQNDIYGIEIEKENTIIYSQETIIPEIFDGNVIVNATLDLVSDAKLIIRYYWLDNGLKNYTNTISYFHNFLDSAGKEPTVIVVDNVVPLNSGIVANYIHGSVMVGDYFYGGCRGGTGADIVNSGVIVKVSVFDVANESRIKTWGSAEGVGFLKQIEQLVYCNGFLWALCVQSSPYKLFLLKVEPETMAYQTFYIGDYPSSEPIAADSEYLYIAHNRMLMKVSPSTFVSNNKFNPSFVFAPELTYSFSSQGGHLEGSYPESYKGLTHSNCVDADFIYLSFVSSNNAAIDRNGYSEVFNKTFHELHKVNKHTMQPSGWVYIPKSTDDMTQTLTHLFFGIEVLSGANPNTYGYGWGGYAIRKSDLRLTALPPYHKDDVPPNTQSYASIIFGNYLVDIKTNKSIYVININDVDNWSLSENIGARTIYSYKLHSNEATPIPRILNELMLYESGKLVGFLWGQEGSEYSNITSFILPDLSLFATPTVSFESSLINDGSIIITGVIFTDGGKPITQRGFKYGLDPDNLTETILSSDATNVFAVELPDNLFGTYYFKAFAINSEGESAAEVKGFSRLNYHWRIKVVGNKTVYGQDNQVVSFKNLTQ